MSNEQLKQLVLKFCEHSNNGLYGETLNSVKEVLQHFDIFKNKNIEVLVNNPLLEGPVITYTENGIPGITAKYQYETVTVKVTPNVQFEYDIVLKSIFVINNEMFISATPTSFITKKEKQTV